MTIKYNKLIRDRIPEIIKQKGGSPVTHIAGDEEYWSKLKEKLQEEVNEFSQNSVAEELADILEVVDAICDYLKIDKIELDNTKKKKAAERGGFKDKIILEES